MATISIVSFYHIEIEQLYVPFVNLNSNQSKVIGWNVRVKRLEINIAMCSESYSEFTFRGVTPADYDLAISVEIEWNQETRREVKTIREIGGQ